MKMKMLVGKDNDIDLLIERNSMTGSLSYSENGQKYTLVSALNILTHFTLTLTKKYDFRVGSDKQYSVVLEHTRPRAFAGLRSHAYKVFVDGELVKEFEAY